MEIANKGGITLDKAKAISELNVYAPDDRRTLSINVGYSNELLVEMTGFSVYDDDDDAPDSVSGSVNFRIFEKESVPETAIDPKLEEEIIDTKGSPEKDEAGDG